MKMYFTCFYGILMDSSNLVRTRTGLRHKELPQAAGSLEDKSDNDVIIINSYIRQPSRVRSADCQCHHLSSLGILPP